MIDKYKEAVDQLTELGTVKGIVTFDQVKKALKHAKPSRQDIMEILDEMENRGIKVERKSNMREWAESIVIAVILALFIRAFIIQAFKIPSGSMQPTLIVGDRLMVSKLRYGPQIPFTDNRMKGFSHSKRGDIIVFDFPLDMKKDFIKRLIAFGGEMVEIRLGDIYINGQMVMVPTVKNIYYFNRGAYGKIGQKTKVPDGFVFVLGDNSKSSHDSRYWGFVPEENIIGRAEIVYWPFPRMRFLHE